MSEITIVDPAAIPEQPWRNGGGTTRELWAQPASDGFTWRISLARIDHAGPFSAMPGIDRILLLADGDLLELDLPGGTVRLGRNDAVAFSGSDAVIARPAPARSATALNLMVRHGTVSGRLRIARVDGHVRWGRQLNGVVLLGGRLTLGGTRLPPFGAAVRIGTALRGRACAALVAEIEILEQSREHGGSR